MSTQQPTEVVHRWRSSVEGRASPLRCFIVFSVPCVAAAPLVAALAYSPGLVRSTAFSCAPFAPGCALPLIHAREVLRIARFVVPDVFHGWERVPPPVCILRACLPLSFIGVSALFAIPLRALQRFPVQQDRRRGSRGEVPLQCIMQDPELAGHERSGHARSQKLRAQ